jgi:hypothetical protein
VSAKLSETTQVIFYGFDPSTKDTLVYDTDTAANLNWINVENWHRVMVIVFRTTGTGSVQQCQLMAASDVNGTGAVGISSSGSTEATILVNAAAGSNDNTGERGAGMIVFDLNTADLEDTLADAKYIQIRMSLATGTDDFGVAFILSEPRYAKGTFTSTGSGGSAPSVV